MNNVIVTLVGPTCSGKTTLKDQMLATGDFIEVISHTTRPMRNGEVNGETYHYVTQEEFDTMEMLERISYNGNTYGGSVQEFEKAFASGLVPVIIVEPNGNEQINKNAAEKGWRVLNVWVGCPVELQAERLVERLLVDYASIGQTEQQSVAKLIREYSSRLVMIQTVENEWVDLFKKSVPPSGDVLALPKFIKENEIGMRNSVMATAIAFTEGTRG